MAPLTDKQTEEAVKKLDPTETKIGYAAAGLAALFALLYTIPYIAHPATKVNYSEVPNKNKSCANPHQYHYVKAKDLCEYAQAYSRGHWVEILLILMIFPVGMLIATLFKRRAALAFTMILSGFALEQTLAGVFGLAWLLGGGWLLVRAWRANRYGTTNAKEVAEISAARRAAAKESRSGRSASTGNTKAAAGSSPAKGSAKTSATATAPSRSNPQANKRYTPKTPPKKKPPPAKPDKSSS